MNKQRNNVSGSESNARAAFYRFTGSEVTTAASRTKPFSYSDNDFLTSSNLSISSAFFSRSQEVSAGWGSLVLARVSCSYTVFAMYVSAVWGTVRGSTGKVRCPSRRQS